MWRIAGDDTPPVLTAEGNIQSGHSERITLELPKTAIVFFMGKATEYLAEKYGCAMLTDRFPRFLKVCPIYRFKEHEICFLNGGSGAPHGVDTLETLNALGVRNAICAGMCGAFAEGVNVGDVIVPNRAYVEEGTSLHYYESIDYAEPDAELLEIMLKLPDIKMLPIVSTDGIYRQTYKKEQLWRGKGAVGVDMETSAMLSVGKYLGVRTAALLTASDKHPMHPGDPKWKWSMTQDLRIKTAEIALAAAVKAAETI